MHHLSFSIIVPTHGRKTALNRCIEAIGRQTYPKEQFELIIIYDGDTPSHLPETEHLPITQITQPHSGPATARNLGAAHARNQYLAFTDDDCFPAADWLSQLSAVLQQYPERLIGGRTLNALPHNSYAVAGQLLVDYLYRQYNSDPKQPRFFTSNNIALNRERFLELDGFDTHFPLAAGEDRELCRRWLDAGYGMYYQSEAVVHHAHQLTLTDFWRQHVNYGRGAYRFRTNNDTRLKFEPLSFYVNLMRYPFQRANGRTAIHLFILITIMQVANAVGFLGEKLQSAKF